MHGKEYAKRIKEGAERLRKQTIESNAAAEIAITLPAAQYAVFYSEPLATMLRVQVNIYNGLMLYTTFTVVNSYPDLAEFQNSSTVPTDYALTATLSPYGSNNGPFTPVQTITTKLLDPTNSGTLISFFTGETDVAGQPVSQDIYMEIKAHP